METAKANTIYDLMQGNSRMKNKCVGLWLAGCDRREISKRLNLAPAMVELYIKKGKQAISEAGL